MNTYKKNPKKPIEYNCEKCLFFSSNKKDFIRHLSTDKHKILINTEGDTYENTQKTLINKKYVCICGNEYKHNQSLYNHKKKCQYKEKSELISISDEEEKPTNELSVIKEMLFQMMNQNKDLQKTIIEQNKTIQEQNKTIQEIVPKVGNNNNNNNIIVNNLTLLNNNCKDALSLNEFIDSIQVEVKDLMHTSEKGLTNGVANIFLENYNKLPLQKRPIWCGDKKRKKLYIKDDEWQEDKNNLKTKNAIKNLTAKQAKSSNKYIKENPDWMKSESKKERFIHIVKETTEEIDENKQLNIINSLLDNVHLSDQIKTTLQQ